MGKGVEGNNEPPNCYKYLVKVSLDQCCKEMMELINQGILIIKEDVSMGALKTSVTKTLRDNK
jgi:hypothetical protein